jgi:transcriptional antiterminator RfaH
MTNFRVGWYLIYTRPRHEKKVHARLVELNVTSFLPTKKIVRVMHDRKKYVDEPLFPSYVFIYLNDMDNYYTGIDAEGSLYYVRSGKEIARVQETVIDSIRLITSNENEIQISSEHILPGQKLVIRQGALTGLACEVVEFRGRQNLLVRVDLLQRNLLMTLPVESLIAI